MPEVEGLISISSIAVHKKYNKTTQKTHKKFSIRKMSFQEKVSRKSFLFEVISVLIKFCLESILIFQH